MGLPNTLSTEKSTKTKRLQVPLLLLIPFLFCFALFWLTPLLQGFYLSLQTDNLLGEGEFAGWQNYRDLLSDHRYFHAVYNTVLYAGMSIVLVSLFSLTLAHLLQKSLPKWRGPLSFCLLLPGLTPPSVLAYLYLLVFNGPHGILNSIFLTPFGLPAIDWIRDPNFIKFSIVLQTLWRWSGFITLFFLSGMEGIPKTYYEVAYAEGASFWWQLRNITLPMLKPILIFVGIFLCLDAFVLFEGAYVLLGGSGGTLDAGLLLVGYTYQSAFTYGKFSQAAAISFSIVPPLLFLIWLILLRPSFNRKNQQLEVNV